MGFGASWMMAACTAEAWRSVREVLSVMDGHGVCPSIGEMGDQWEEARLEFAFGLGTGGGSDAWVGGMGWAHVESFK